MSTARDFLAAVQQRADLCSHYQGVAGDVGRTDVPRLVAALTAALDDTEPGNLVVDEDASWVAGYRDAMRDIRAVITDALTPKENDS